MSIIVLLIVVAICMFVFRWAFLSTEETPPAKEKENQRMVDISSATDDKHHHQAKEKENQRMVDESVEELKELMKKNKKYQLIDLIIKAVIAFILLCMLFSSYKIIDAIDGVYSGSDIDVRVYGGRGY